ncbi:MAG: heme exporter protein CcmB [bacterium]|nr:heme exporter protein CcmB [bacterium]
MKLFWRQIGTLFLKDLKITFREPHSYLAVVLFGLLLLLLFSFALSVNPELMRKMTPGLFWLTVLFATTLSLERSFQMETEGGQWEGLLLTGLSPSSLFLGKMLANLFFVLLLEIILFPLSGILFDIHLTFSVWAVLLLGSLGITTLGTFYSGLTATLRGGQALLPLLLFPMLIPLILSAVRLTELALSHDLFGQQVAWLKLLILFDIVFLLGSILLSETLFDRS